MVLPRSDRGGNSPSGIFAGILERERAIGAAYRAAEGLRPAINVAQLAKKQPRVACGWRVGLAKKINKAAAPATPSLKRRWLIRGARCARSPAARVKHERLGVASAETTQQGEFHVQKNGTAEPTPARVPGSRAAPGGLPHCGGSGPGRFQDGPGHREDR
jgi:hypothetical protein